MYIERDFTLRPVTDFKKNVQPKLNESIIAEEVYKGSMLIGWNIKNL